MPLTQSSIGKATESDPVDLDHCDRLTEQIILDGWKRVEDRVDSLVDSLTDAAEQQHAGVGPRR